MRLVRQPEILPPRTVSAPVGATSGRYRPWYEVSVLLDAGVPEWGWRDVTWHHWAIPCAGEGPDPGAVRAFDPARRAAMPGAPPHVAGPALDEGVALRLARAAMSGLEREVHRQPRLGLVSTLAEGREAFRRRCLASLGPALRLGRLHGGEGAARVAALARGIESRTLAEGELSIIALQVRIGWYPEGTEPLAAAAELLVSGPARHGGR